ncbi:MAG: hypothetical protein MJ094_09350 [Saccharofermentans sp.]|nr:hypothetical protein [Saccharofermentans sp.]
METYSYHCPTCGGGLKLNVFSQRLMCELCGNDYNPATLAHEGNISSPNNTRLEQQTIVKNFVEMNLYHCGSCGAEVVTNDVEVTKICSFCGQSAIIYDRVTKMDKPDLIIPFKISKEDAILAVTEHYKKAKFIPAEFNTLSIDSVYAIYVPYFVFEAELVASGHINIPSQNNSVVRKDFSGKTKRHVFFDSSKILNDSVSIYLNPFPYRQAVPFEPTYLSGFYADISDVDSEKLSPKLTNYMWEILSEELVSNIPGVASRNVRANQKDIYDKFTRAGREHLNTPIVDTHNLNIISTESVLCPIYFVTFKTTNGLANIMVNGCTGKVVGSIPANEVLVKKTLIRNCAIMAPILAIVFAFAFMHAPLVWIGGIATILTMSFIISGMNAKKRYDTITKEMNTSSMFKLRRR